MTAPAECDCPATDGMIRHQRPMCTDPVAAKLNWYADHLTPEQQARVAKRLRTRKIRSKVIEQLGTDDLRHLLQLVAANSRDAFDEAAADLATSHYGPRDLLTGMLHEIGPGQ
jgi:hypothetical protein